MLALSPLCVILFFLLEMLSLDIMDFNDTNSEVTVLNLHYNSSVREVNSVICLFHLWIFFEHLFNVHKEQWTMQSESIFSDLKSILEFFLSFFTRVQLHLVISKPRDEQYFFHLVSVFWFVYLFWPDKPTHTKWRARWVVLFHCSC